MSSRASGSAAASSSSSTPKPATTPAADAPLDADLAALDKLLNREASAFQRHQEVERILGAFKLDPYAILDLGLGAKAEDVKRKYRQLSLCEHSLEDSRS
jgi:DnaJ homolog subfamily C member 8